MKMQNIKTFMDTFDMIIMATRIFSKGFLNTKQVL